MVKFEVQQLAADDISLYVCKYCVPLTYFCTNACTYIPEICILRWQLSLFLSFILVSFPNEAVLIAENSPKSTNEEPRYFLHQHSTAVKHASKLTSKQASKQAG
ncbi:hypothetical protein TWF569_001004 [Orbilia oligospora]|uniref:Uncharacterized protein n=1 Tax=Orbilia oligospora TaxID=2813651 RepID=A0A7C8IWB6_ORBOL|nr:hypothetical protein TWF102_003597 [Orbilia oligospora]KAF3114047.1 hypothetical protein TWF103_001489 [Orbilia oligospora]KAF3127276.1 hypothetical protein TWF594_000745 [Orbilia oligospora]KAF3154180.1 hypothetical protein TWF569_001004 [Orbilia oligospora]